MNAQDSYFGQTGYSFYGGPNGQSFSIKKIFRTKVALDNDLSNGLSSNIGPGDYVIINYYYPNYNIDTYEANAKTDQNKYGDDYIYNATLWQKQTDTTAINGLKYELIADFKTVTPGLKLTTDLQDPGSYQPYDEETGNYIEEADDSTSALKHYQLAIAKPWKIDVGTCSSVAPGVGPSVEINYKEYSSSINPESTDTRYLHFKLPNAWGIELVGSSVDSATPPSAILVEHSSDDNNFKKWQLNLPNPWNIAKGTDTVYCDPGVLGPDPQITIDRIEDPNNPEESNTTKYIHFKIPNAWKLEGGTITETNPGESDNFSVSTSTEDPTSGETSTDTQYINLSLPKPWKFDVGTYTLKSSTDNPSIAINHKKASNASVEESDEYYYFHFGIPSTQKFSDDHYGPAFYFYLLNSSSTEATTKTGFNPLDTNKEYPKVNVNLSLPIINSEFLNPYYKDVTDNEYKLNSPTIKASTSSNWTVDVGLVKPPDLAMNLSVVPSKASPSFSTQKNETGITWTAEIPKGTRIIYSATEPIVDEASNIMPGDFYINDNKDLYEYSGTYGTEWIKQLSLSGNDFSIKAEISVNDEDLTQEASLTLYQRLGDYIDSSYPDLATSLKTNEVLNIVYHPDNDDKTEYHWLYKLASGNWSGSQITGSVSNTFIKNSWTTDSSSDTYSITRINELRTKVETNETNINNVVTKSFSLTLARSSWNRVQNRLDYYENTVSLPSGETLHCGVNNSVPPLIYHGSTAINLYNLLDDVQVNDVRTALTFYIKDSDYNAINADIPVIVIDHR